MTVVDRVGNDPSAAEEAVAVTCKKCGAEMRRTSGRGAVAYECLGCHFVRITAAPLVPEQESDESPT